MDPSHIHRAGENAEEALKAVVVTRSPCPHQRLQGPPGPAGRPRGPGLRERRHRPARVRGGPARRRLPGAVELEVIGAKGYDLVACQAIASESRGHLQACLQACGER